MGKVLVVESDPDFRALIIFSFRFAGFDVLGASTGDECIREVKRNQPDLVLISDKAPEIDAHKICQEIMLDKHGGALPAVLVLLDEAIEQWRMGDIQKCGGEVVAKPISVDKLTRKVIDHFKKLNP